jgi:asparagine synthase (glutamine-hydrolysing)
MGSMAAYLSSSTPPDTSAVDRMFDAAPHRGSRRVIESHGRCAIGVSFSGGPADASIATRDGVTAAVCGRIDNLDDLTSVMSGPPDRTPAEAVLAAFRTFGDGAPNRLRGVFAGILTDGSSLKAFRDHVGFEPLFYRDEGPEVYMATEAKQIIAGAGIAREPDRGVVDGMLFDNYSDETFCALRGVRRAPQASMVFAGPNGVRWERYWQPEHLIETAHLGPEEIQQRFDELMRRATARVLMGNDVITLSGGIDSPAVAAYAAPEELRRTGRPLAALSSVYPRFPRVDERPYIELVAKELGLELHLYEAKSTPFDGLRELIRLCDGPAPATALAQTREEHTLAHSLGYQTILTGEFAEYLIDVGQPHLVTHLLYKRRTSALRALFRSQRARGVGLGNIGRQLARAALPGLVVDAYEHGRDDPYRADWLDRAKFRKQGPRRPPPRQRWRQWQLGVIEMPSWSFEADAINQAASGIRVRRPWMDVDLWEFFLSLRAETKYPDVQPKKLLARRLLRGRVPDAILDRNHKTYFDDWLMAMIDYPFLRQLLIEPEERIPGVDYARLAEHLRREDLTVKDFLYVRDLAAIHAFLET